MLPPDESIIVEAGPNEEGQRTFGSGHFGDTEDARERQGLINDRGEPI